MKAQQVVAKTTLLLALSLLPTSLPAQSFHLVSQEGFVSASAAVSGPTGSDSNSEQQNVPSAGPIDVFAGAGASLPEVFASATAHLEASLTPHAITMTGILDGNGAATFPEMQSAGGSSGANLTIMFRVDAPALLTMIGETSGVWTGDAGVEPSLFLSSTSGVLADLIGTGGRIEFEGMLLPEETYTLSGSGLASAVTSEFNSFSSAQGGFTARLQLQAAAVPETGSLALLCGIGIASPLFCLGNAVSGDSLPPVWRYLRN
jgi:hypothetical protein